MQVFNDSIFNTKKQEQLRLTLAEKHHFVEKSLIENSFLDAMTNRIETHPELLKERDYDGIGSDLLLHDLNSHLKLNAVFNQQEFLDFISYLTKMPIKAATPKISILKPGMEIGWHDDSGHPNRVLALRVDLSKNYSGGEFSLKDKTGKTLTSNQLRLSYGDGLFFKTGTSEFSHSVSPVSEGERRSIIIWFLNQKP